MRNYLQSDLRKAFDTAWRMLPRAVQADLKTLTVSVKAVDTLLGAKVRCADGTYFRSDQEACAWFACESSLGDLRGFLLIDHSRLKNEPEEFIIATILHELSHGLSYVQKGYEATQVPESRSELAAWLQAASWAANGINEYDRALDVVFYCMMAAQEELRNWRGEKLRDLLTKAALHSGNL